MTYRVNNVPTDSQAKQSQQTKTNYSEANCPSKEDIPSKRHGKIYKFFYNIFHYNTGSNPRIWELDLFRGLLILFVTLDHMVSFGMMFGVFDFKTPVMIWITDNILLPYRDSAFRKGIQPFGLFTFSLLSGISCALSHSSGKRILKMVILCGAFMGAFALLHVINPDIVGHYIIFNIINVLTICVIVWFVFDLIKLPYWMRTVLGLLIVAIGLTYYYSYFVLDDSYIENELLSLFVYNSHATKLVVNFEPLFPHMGFFFLGGVVGKAVYSDKKTRTKSVEPIKPLIPLALIGKNSLINYLFLAIFILCVIWGVEHLVWLFI